MNRSKLLLTILAAAVAGAVGFGYASSKAATNATAAPADLSAVAALQNAYVNVYQHVSPSVVQIQTSEGLGSGIVFDTKGDIVTNDHVVGTAKSFTVTTSTGKILKGTLVGTFQEE